MYKVHTINTSYIHNNLAITSYKNARSLIRQIERDELLEEMVKNYIGLDK